MVWAFFSSVVIQCLISIQGLAGGGRLDTFLHSEGSVVPWLSGYTFGVCCFYLFSSLISVLTLALALGFPIIVWQMLAYALLAIPTSIGCVYLVYGFEIWFSRTFHFINLLLDVLVIFSCVLWPLNTFSGIAGIVTRVSPLTHLNEFIRQANPLNAFWGLLLSLIFLLCGLSWVTYSTKKYQRDGMFGGSR